MSERAFRVAATALLVAIVTVLPAGAGRATAQDTNEGRLRLVDQTYWRAPGTAFSLLLEVRTTAPVADVELAAVVYPKLRNRSELTMTIDGRNPRNAFRVFATPLAELPTDPNGYVTLEVNPDLAADGVYPVRIELREKGGGQVYASLVTHLVNVTAPVSGDPLHTALVLPIAAPPSVAPDGQPSLDAARARAIGDLASSIESHAGVPLTLWPTPDTLAALDESSRDVDRTPLAMIGSALAGRQVIAAPYVPVSNEAMVAAGLESELTAQLTRGVDTVRSTLGVSPDTHTRVVEERIDDAAMAQLTAEDTSRLVVPETLLDASTLRTTLTGRVRLALKRDEAEVGVGDAGLAAHFDRAANDPVLSAHQMLADLAQIYFDAPGASGRGVIALPSRDWIPSGPFLDTLLTGLGASPLLDSVSLDGFFTKVDELTTRARPLHRSFRSDLPPPSSLPGAAIRAARRRIEAFTSAVPSQSAIVDRLDRTLLVAESSPLRPRDRTEYLAGVNAQVASQVHGISLPVSRSITLTAREGEIPITITNSLPYPVRAVLFVESDTLQFPKGSRFELSLQRRNTTTRLSVLARASGSFPLRVRLESPEGGLVLQESRMTVRSTALSGVGVGLSVGAGAFLLVWWAVHLRRARRGRRAAVADAATPA
ncbi:MAG TPA: DUF6049 family protein [Acidimicrobiales bacterium]|nr:DUF6049 family protein [Acidimicrobiales bacterium]